MTPRNWNRHGLTRRHQRHSDARERPVYASVAIAISRASFRHVWTEHAKSPLMPRSACSCRESDVARTTSPPAVSTTGAERPTALGEAGVSRNADLSIGSSSRRPRRSRRDGLAGARCRRRIVGPSCGTPSNVPWAVLPNLTRSLPTFSSQSGVDVLQGCAARQASPLLLLLRARCDAATTRCRYGWCSTRWQPHDGPWCCVRKRSLLAVVARAWSAG